MIQEIITYIIIAVAVLFTFLLIRKKFGNKKRLNKTAGAKNATFENQHKCSDCSAECVLRDVTSDKLQSNGDLCRKIETASSD